MSYPGDQIAAALDDLERRGSNASERTTDHRLGRIDGWKRH